MDITLPRAKEQARSLKAALAQVGIGLRHTAALDLVCTAHGLRNRMVLGDAPVASAAAPAEALAKAVRRFASRDDRRFAAILAATTAITHPAGAAAGRATIAVDVGCAAVEPFELAADALEDPDRHLDTAAGRKLVASVADGYFHFAWERSSHDRAIELKRANELARALIDGARSDDRPSLEETLEETLGWEPQEACDSIREQTEGQFVQVVGAIRDAAADAGLVGFDEEAWTDGLKERTARLLEERDGSRPEDMFGSWDECEVVFFLGEPELGWEDRAVSSCEAWSAPGTLAVDANLQNALAAIGWSVPEFRKAAGNRRAAGEGCVPGRRVHRPKLVGWADLAEVTENVGSQHFAYCFYAIVPLTDVMRLDPGKPITFSKAAFAAYDPMNGAFHEAGAFTDLTLKPSQGRLESPGGWYGPDQVCDFVRGCFRSSLKNAAPRPRKGSAAAGASA